MMKYQFPVEVHSHTIHSDGQFTVAKLVESAIDFGYKGLILTDHNTSAGYLEMATLPQIQDETLITLHGMEWTTYFGHMLAHDANYDVDWREATPDTIDTYMREVREADGLVGIAHPYDIGSPICTGCHWDYKVQDYNLVNYIEIWNSNEPQEKSESILAYEFWLDKLNKGYEISCSAGRDWQRPDKDDANMGVTYLELAGDRLTQTNFKAALRQGSYYITLGPTAEFVITREGENFYMGDRVKETDIAEGTVSLEVMPAQLPDLKQFVVKNAYVTIWNNDQLLYRSDKVSELNGRLDVEFTLPSELSEGYVRFEVRGDFKDTKDTLIIVGNPIYVKSRLD